MFVFDVADTEPGPYPTELPPEVDRPFDICEGRIGDELGETIENAKRDGVRIQLTKEGSQSAGSICRIDGRRLTPLQVCAGLDKQRNPIFVNVPLRYDLFINENLSREAQYATIVHELAHLYCGHLGTPNKTWWPDRLGLSNKECEFEAESISYMLCKRLKIRVPSDSYLSGYLKDHQEIPRISVECVMKAAGLIEQMGRIYLKPRKNESE